jgi:HlyD family secretion protein
VAERRAVEQRLRSLREGPRTEEVTGAEARAGAAAATVDLASQRLDLYQLRAPGPGRVLEVEVDPGEVVGPGTPILSVADTRRPYADVFVPQDQVGAIRVGARARVKVDAEPAAFAGVIEHVSSRTEFTPRFVFSERERPNLVVRVRVRIDDPHERLHAGVPAFVTLESSR